jgi:hypothetical protein
MNISSNDVCSICLCEGTNHKLMCGHSFHPDCIQSWLKRDNTCPYCRKSVNLETEFPIINHIFGLFPSASKDMIYSTFTSCFGDIDNTAMTVAALTDDMTYINSAHSLIEYNQL